MKKKHALSEPIKALLLTIDRFCTKVHVPYFLIGATARDILFHHLHGFPIRRLSLDIDFGIAVQDWTHFQMVLGQLTQSGAFRRHQRIAHRFYFDAGIGDELCVDLVPCGNVEAPDGTVAWPPDQSIIMTVAGYTEALEHAIQFAVDENVTIPICSIPGLVLTKLIAWLDRGDREPKDASDFAYVLQNYARAGNEERLFSDEAYAVLAAQNHDPDAAGATLLGQDVARLAKDAARMHLHSILFEAPREKLLSQMMASVHAQERPKVANYLGYFIEGYAEVIASSN
ncbi:nucleotidyl transferase AbiEii/AbiGii toxin family protein [Robbsia andropogonis]|uniref:nucleotidyl transferase AbiEii/AbiGii toxin family protein n=1 Tax=Robbsia andropogonis TaxID=28092 RepID=UPI002A6A907D|nr:nucleotidyl transferase AbiEii/AbiGii toxin family protein [Robbsia andropogonis]